MKLIVEIIFIAVIICLIILFIYRPKMVIKLVSRIIRKCWSLIRLWLSASNRNMYSKKCDNGGNVNDDSSVIMSKELMRLFQMNIEELHGTVKKLNSQVMELQSVIQCIQSENQKVLTQNESLRKLVKELDLNRIRTSESKIENLRENQRFEKRLLYASIVDCQNPVGFMNDNLHKSDLNSCFIIEIQNLNSAIFSIVDNADAHMAIITNSNAFTNVCNIQNDNFNATRIEVLNPGRLLLEGDIWIVKEKVSIKIF